MMKKIYRSLDSQGRLVLPYELREEADIQKGDILEISCRENQIIIEKIDIVKLNDASKESMENTVVSVARKLDRRSLLMLARRLVEFAEKKEESEIDESVRK